MDEMGQKRPEAEKAEWVEERKRQRVERARAMAVGGSADHGHENYESDADEFAKSTLATKDHVTGENSPAANTLRDNQIVSIKEVARQAIAYARQNADVLMICFTAGCTLGILIDWGRRRRRKPEKIGRSTAMNASVNFPKLVDSVADAFEGLQRMRVNSQARRELVIPALPYQEHVEEEIAAGKITREFLRQSLFVVLENAYQIAMTENQSEIDEETVKESMKRYCPYLFWC